MFHGALDSEVCHDHIVGDVDAVDAARFQVVNVAFGVKDFCHRHVLNNATETLRHGEIEKLCVLVTQWLFYRSGRPSSPSNALTAALRAVRISASEPESHIRPKRPTDEM